MRAQIFKTSHRPDGPDGKIADELASTLACTTAADALVNYSLMYVPQTTCEFPIAPMGKMLTRLPRLAFAHRSTPASTCRRDLESSHRPDGKIADGPASTLNYLNYLIAPIGDSRVARCLQGGGVVVIGGSVTIDSCTIAGNTAYMVRAQAPNFPSPPWETHVWLTVCRAAVFLSIMVAQ
jgi:hypothetical protein